MRSSKPGCENFIIIGDTDGRNFVRRSKSRGFRAGRDRPSIEWEGALTAEFGDRFINMRQFHR
ncbi:MAG: hypothetical protein ACLT98_13525 [Eggerthellaceae bacterium]